MRIVAALMIVTFLFLAGCRYEKPLVKEHAIPVDSAVLGLWELQSGKEQGAADSERLVILKFSDTEYLIHYPPGGNDEAYYRGYSIKLGGISCVQLEVIGTKDGMLRNDFKTPFTVVSYELKNGILEIKTLNPDLVDDELKTTEALAQAFLNHKDDKNLFIDPARFKRISESKESKTLELSALENDY